MSDTTLVPCVKWVKRIGLSGSDSAELEREQPSPYRYRAAIRWFRYFQATQAQLRVAESTRSFTQVQSKK